MVLLPGVASSPRLASSLERGVVAKRGIVTEGGIIGKHGVIAERGIVTAHSVVTEGGIVANRGVVITDVASLLRLASSLECGVVVAERALSGVALLPSGVASSPEHGVVVILAAIDNGVTTK